MICSKIAGDESRHEKAYQAIFQEILRKDPEGGLKSFYEMMQDQITMPACLMTDGKDDNMFEAFSVTAQKVGVYTAVDYAEILQYLVDTWDIEHIGGLSGEAVSPSPHLSSPVSGHLYQPRLILIFALLSSPPLVSLHNTHRL